ncbi:MAG: leucyl/phenylalanyl-tRNA--protein transferase [Bacteroidota bacterium]
MTVYLLPEEPFFPPAEEAEADGLIAIGGDLSAPRLLQAYAQGIFPWFVEYDEFYWYSPDPRLLLFPGEYKVPGSFRRILKKAPFEVRFDTDFERVILSCAAAGRPEQDGTWISDEFIEGYTELYKLGFAHSVESYFEGQLVGGLYGVSIGSAFFGESMFFTRSNASKVAFYRLVERIRTLGFTFIDCQVATPHMISLGARPVPRRDYLALLEEAMKMPTIKGPWH